MRTLFKISVDVLDPVSGSGGSRMVLSGREAWALNQLHCAGTRGCTPIDNPAPRWSGYVHCLRKAGFDIETITEPHGGQFAGTHARYVLRSHVIVREVGQ